MNGVDVSLLVMLPYFQHFTPALSRSDRSVMDHAETTAHVPCSNPLDLEFMSVIDVLREVVGFLALKTTGRYIIRLSQLKIEGLYFAFLEKIALIK